MRAAIERGGAGARRRGALRRRADVESAPRRVRPARQPPRRLARSSCRPMPPASPTRASPRRLAEAGLDGAMVSLHGSTAAISDAVTGAPGTFVATLRGIDELVRTPVRVRLNFVFCQENRDDFPRVVDLVAERWPTAGIVFSFVGSHTDVVPRTTALIPRFRDVMPSLLAGLARARAAGLDVTGFDSMCGLPLCLVPEAERAAFSHVALPAEAGAGEFVKAEACARCAETHRCFGVRRGYAELYGTGELQPVRGERRGRPDRPRSRESRGRCGCSSLARRGSSAPMWCARRSAAATRSWPPCAPVLAPRLWRNARVSVSSRPISPTLERCASWRWTPRPTWRCTSRGRSVRTTATRPTTCRASRARWRCCTASWMRAARASCSSAPTSSWRRATATWTRTTPSPRAISTRCARTRCIELPGPTSRARRRRSCGRASSISTGRARRTGPSCRPSSGICSTGGGVR